MPIAFIAIGAVFLVAAITGRVSDQNGNPGLITLLKGDLTGKNNFFIWIVAIGAIGALGYIPGFKGLSVAMLTLILLVIFLSNNKNGGTGLFANFQNALASTENFGTGTIPVNGGANISTASTDPLDTLLNQVSPQTNLFPTSGPASSMAIPVSIVSAPASLNGLL
jgi:hypothetical protein